MADPITMAIATSVAGKVAESLSDQAKSAVAGITRRIRDKFRDHPAALATLEAAREDPAKIPELAALLDEAGTEDPEFRNNIRALWNRGFTAEDEGVMNIFQGQADKVIQMRDVHGNLNIG